MMQCWKHGEPAAMSDFGNFSMSTVGEPIEEPENPDMGSLKAAVLEIGR